MNKNKFLPLCGTVPVLAAGLYYAILLKDIAQQTGDMLPLKLYALLLPAVLFDVAAAGLVLFGAAAGLAISGKIRLLSGRLRGRNFSRSGGLGSAGGAGNSGGLGRLYFLAGLYLGVLFILVMPGLSAPDEMSHYLTAYRLSSRMLGKADLEPVTGLAAVRTEDYPLEDLSGVKTPAIPDDEEPAAEVLGNPVTYYTYRTIADWDLRYPEQGGMVISGLADVRTTPVMYLPQAAGMALVRAFGGSALSLVFAARFLNLLAFLLLTSAAIVRMPFGREILCGVGLLPMTLHLAASMSYDAGILGCSFLLCAEIGRRTRIYWNTKILGRFGGTSNPLTGIYLRRCLRAAGDAFLSAGIRFHVRITPDAVEDALRSGAIVYLQVYGHPKYKNHHMLCYGFRYKGGRREFLLADGWSPRPTWVGDKEIGRGHYLTIHCS